MAFQQFSPLGNWDPALQRRALAAAVVGRGAFLPGEVYWQEVAGGLRPIQITKRHEDGRVEGWYLGAPSETERSFGIDFASLLPAEWTDPAMELVVRTEVTDERIRDVIRRVFGLEETRQDDEPARLTGDRR